MDVIGGRYTCVPEGKHGRGQRDRKVQVFQGTRNLYSRPVDAHQPTVLCAFRETNVTRQLISNIAINRPLLFDGS